MISPVNSIASIRSRLALCVSMAGLFAGSAGVQSAPAAEIVAHRGGFNLFPENTCAAFRACEGIADRIEFDVQVSADGELVVIHDDTVDRTTDGSGAVAGLTLAQLKKLDAGSTFSSAFAGERIPTLAEALRALPPGMPAMVDCKTGSAPAIVAALRDQNALATACVSCGGLELLQAIRRLDSSVELAYAASGSLGPDNVAVAKRMGATAFAWNKADVTKSVVDLVHAAGMRIFVYSPTPAEVPAFLDMGVDGLYADDPKASKEAARLHSRSFRMAMGPGATPAESRPISAPIDRADSIDRRSGRVVGFPTPDWRPGAEDRAQSPSRPNGASGESRADGMAANPPPTAVPADLSARMPLLRDLVACWNLDDGLSDPASVNAEEATGQSRGRLAGFASSPGWVSGGADAVAGGALRLDGRDDYVRIPPNEFLDIGANAVTLSLWVKLTVLPSRLSEDFSFIYGSDLAAYSLYLDRNGAELLFMATDADRHSARVGIPESALRTGVWHHVVGVYEGAAAPAAGRVAIYLDGQLRNAQAGADASPGLGLTGPVLPGQFAAIGRRGDQDESYFSGIVDDVALWRRPLSPDEIVRIHASGSEGIPLERIPAGR